MEFDLLLEKIFISDYSKKRKSLLFWMIYLKKSWLLYCILFFFTSVFVVLYLISNISFLFYSSIIYPVILFLVLMCEGIIRNYLFLKKEDLNNTEIDIYKDNIKVINKQEGYTYINEYPYKNISSINYSDEQFIFEIKKNLYIKIPKDKLSNTTFEFLVAVIKEKEEY